MIPYIREMQLPLISILTPFKNTAEFLPECLDSILEQSFSNWELLIVDDGSSDTSHSIVSAYAEKDARIKLFSNNGDGIIEALRLAFRESRGEFITRMDSDDIMATDKLKVLATNLMQSGVGHVAVGLVQYFSEDGINEGYRNYENWLNGLTRTGNNYAEIYKECVIPSPCWMIHREDLIKCGAFDPERYPEDYDLTFRFYANKMKCITCNEILHQWRDYETRTSRTHEHYSQNYFLDIKLDYFLKLDFDNQRELTVWGAGFKGKSIAKSLVGYGIPFHWICDNPKKIGRKIYDQELKPFQFLTKLSKPQSIITVANSDAQDQIREYLKSRQMQPMLDYFFFC